MLDIETPRLSTQRLLIASLLFLGFEILKLLKIGIIFGHSIWPIPMIWILSGSQKFAPDFRLVIWIFVLGLISDILLGVKLGLNGSCALLAIIALWAFHRFSPIVPTTPRNLTLIAGLAYILGLMGFGLLINNSPNLLGLLIPFVVSVVLSPFLFVWFNLDGGGKNER